MAYALSVIEFESNFGESKNFEESLVEASQGFLGTTILVEGLSCCGSLV